MAARTERTREMPRTVEGDQVVLDKCWDEMR